MEPATQTRPSYIIYDTHNDVLVLYKNGHWELPGGDLAELLGIELQIERTLGERDGQTWQLATIASGNPSLEHAPNYQKFGFFSLVALTQRYDELSPSLKNFLEAMAYGEVDLDI